MRRLFNSSLLALRRPIQRQSRSCARLLSLSARANEPAQPGQSGKVSDKGKTKAEPTPLSSCPEKTVLVGVNYLKDQMPVLAKKDEEYPPWLWNLLKPKVIPNDGPGGKGEKMRMRAANKRRIKEKNFLKTQ